jgi:hypothetical protein
MDIGLPHSLDCLTRQKRLHGILISTKFDGRAQRGLRMAVNIKF